MEIITDFIPSGSVTTPLGFLAGATCAGIKPSAGNKLDLGILRSEVPATAAGVFTRSKIKAAPVLLSQQRLQSGRSIALVVNSGCANAYTGEQGVSDAVVMTNVTAQKLGLSPDDVLVCSTGVTGEPLPMERIKDGIGRIELSNNGGHQLAQAIMTTDTVAKEVAVTGDTGTGRFIIGGIAKGSGMIHPDMATLLCFLTTDAAVDGAFLKTALIQAVDISFNMVSIDGDTSPNDSVLILANGKAANKPISIGDPEAEIFQQALNQVCIYLARCIARDGEGASKLIQVTVSGAATLSEARLAARTIVASPLVKSAVFGNDPNWGRVIAALARSGVELVESKIDLYIGKHCLLKAGGKLAYDEGDVVAELKNPEILIDVRLNLGPGDATAWGCDLTEEYVVINSRYTT